MRSLILLSVISLMACGPGDGLKIDMSKASLSANIDRVELYLTPQEGDCEIVALSRKLNGDQYKPIFRAQANIVNGLPATPLELFDIVPGIYRVSVFGFDSLGVIVGFGCEDKTVEFNAGERVDITIDVVDPPWF